MAVSTKSTGLGDTLELKHLRTTVTGDLPCQRLK